MNLDSKVVHAGDRKRTGGHVPVTTPIYTASSFFYDRAEQLDRVFAMEEDGFAYARYANPTNAALEELITALEGGAGTLACASGMAAIQIALTAALMDRRKSVVAASALYGATTSVLMKVLEPFGTEVTLVDICDLDAVRAAMGRANPGAVLIETISNPLVRVPDLDAIAALTHDAGAALLVDNTFASPMLVRPIEHGADFVVHSATKYLAGHGDVLAGLVTANAAHIELLRSLSRAYGPVLGPFEAYLTMRGVKTFALRMARQCENALTVAEWLGAHPRVARVHFPGDPAHPDAAVIRKLLPDGRYGAMLSFELREGRREDVFRFMDSLKMIVPATSLGDVHTMVLYPPMSSHRDLSPKQRERIGITEDLVRLSMGIEAAADIIADLDQALAV
ncbi:MAG: PLP-dependent transferase [Acidobacteria bacterium]|nr:PLP-dependent transferase [Acidobacteriota bacterium]